jgi:hypothetical protein
LASCATTPGVKVIDSKYTIIAPHWGFAVQFPSEGFSKMAEDTRRAHYFFQNKKTGLNVSFIFEHPANCTSSESCRDFFANKLKNGFPNKKNWQMSRLGDIYISEHMDGPIGESDRKLIEQMMGTKRLEDFPIGLDLKQQHWNAHVVEKGIWLDVHLSKGNYDERDRELFVNFLTSLVIRRSRD